MSCADTLPEPTFEARGFTNCSTSALGRIGITARWRSSSGRSPLGRTSSVFRIHIGSPFLIPFSSEVSLSRCCWIKLGLLIANQEAQDRQACPHGSVATILWPSASLIQCSLRPAATRKTRQSDLSFIEGWRQRRFPIVLSRVENGFIDHEAGSRLAWGNDFSDNTNDQNGQSSKG